MTKRELENKIGELAANVEDLVSSIDSCKDEAKKILSMIENLPDISDLEDDEKED